MFFLINNFVIIYERKLLSFVIVPLVTDKLESSPRQIITVERGSSVVECRTRNRESPGSNPTLLPFRSLGFFVLLTMPQSTQLYK